MRNNRKRSLLAVTVSLLCLAQPLLAGEWFHPTYGHYPPCTSELDWQLFAPVGDWCCDDTPQNEGYFFSIDHIQTRIQRPDRTPIGNNIPTNANGQVAPVPVWLPNSVGYVYVTPATPFAAGSPFAVGGNSNLATLNIFFPVVGSGAGGFQFNGIDDAYSRSTSGFGQRYELGWIQDDVGWMANLIVNVSVHLVDEYGFDDKRLDQLAAAQGLDGLDGVAGTNPPQDLNGDGVIDTNPVPPVAPVAGIQSILSADGLLDVPVFFNDPLGLLRGFIDANADQLPDDVNGNGTTTDPNPPPDPALGNLFNVDPGDLLVIGVVFDDLRARHDAQLTGVELMTIRRKKRLYGGSSLDMFLGARYLELDDRFQVVARGGTLSDSTWNNRAVNRVVGPQFGFRLARSRNRLTTSCEGRFLAGANFLSIRQDGTLGSHLSTGAPGVPIGLGANTFFHRLSKQRFSPTGDFKFEAAYQATRALRFRVGYTGSIVGGISRGSNTVLYDIPQLGIVDRKEELFVSTLNIGFEFNR